MEAETDMLVEEERTRFMSRLDQPGSIPLMPGLRELLEALAHEIVQSTLLTAARKLKPVESQTRGIYLCGYSYGNDFDEVRRERQIGGLGGGDAWIARMSDNALVVDSVSDTIDGDTMTANLKQTGADGKEFPVKAVWKYGPNHVTFTSPLDLSLDNGETWKRWLTYDADKKK